MHSLTQGQIVWVTICDSHGGNPKTRPAVILTPTSKIAAAGQVQIAAITTLVGQAPFAETVELPHDPNGHSQTLLKRPCEVVCSWIVDVPMSSLKVTGGSVPSDVLAEIVEKVARLN